MATTATSALQIDTQQFLHYISKIGQSSIASDLDRREIVVGIQALLARLQSPREKTTQLLHVNSYTVAAVKSLVNLKLFSIWAEHDGGLPKSLEELAELTSAEPLLLERLLRLLVTSDMIDTNDEERYVFGDFARGLTAGKLSHSWMLHSMTTANSVIALPRYLEANGYRTPTDSQNSPWAAHMGMPFIEYLKSHPAIFSHVNEVMKVKNMDTLPWFATYPIDALLEDCDPEGVVFVDIGGGTGYDIKTLLEHFGVQKIGPNRLVLQDLPAVIEEANDFPPAIVKQPHDFFTEQPVKGARAYYMHNVLHDWSAEECQQILARIRDAMKPGYSRLLLNETVISSASAPTACATDLSMMTVNAGGERTSKQWHELLGVSGFRISKIYLSPMIDEGLIEAEL